MYTMWYPDRPLRVKETDLTDKLDADIMFDEQASPSSPRWSLTGLSARLRTAEEDVTPRARIAYEQTPGWGEFHTKRQSLKLLRKELRAYRKLRRSELIAKLKKAFSYEKRWRDGFDTITIRRVRKIKTRVRVTVPWYYYVSYGKRKIRVLGTKSWWRTVVRYAPYDDIVRRPRYRTETRVAWKRLLNTVTAYLTVDTKLQRLSSEYYDLKQEVATLRARIKSWYNHARADRNAAIVLTPPEVVDRIQLAVHGGKAAFEQGLGLSLGWYDYPSRGSGALFDRLFLYVADPSRLDPYSTTVETRESAVGAITVPDEPNESIEAHAERILQRALGFRAGRIDMQDSIFCALRSLIELKDLPELGKTVTSFLRWLRKGKFTAATQLGQAASLYLAYRFGVDPTLQDAARLTTLTAWWVTEAHKGLVRLLESVLSDRTSMVPVLNIRGRVGPHRIPPAVAAQPYSSYDPNFRNQGLSLRFNRVRIGGMEASLAGLKVWWPQNVTGGSIFSQKWTLVGRDSQGDPVTMDIRPAGLGPINVSWEVSAPVWDNDPPTDFDTSEGAFQRLLTGARLARILRTAVNYRSVVFTKVRLEQAYSWLSHRSTFASFVAWGQPLKTAWEILPLSFIVDWFTNMNAVAQAIQDLATQNVLGPLVEEVWYSTRADMYFSLQEPTATCTRSFAADYQSASDVGITVSQYGNHTILDPDGLPVFYNPGIDLPTTFVRSLEYRMGLLTQSTPDQETRKYSGMYRYQRGRVEDYSPSTLPRIQVSPLGGKLASLAAIIASMIGGK